MHAIEHSGCTDTVKLRKLALQVDWEKNPLPHLGPDLASVLPLAFQPDALSTAIPFPRARGRSHVMTSTDLAREQQLLLYI